MAKQDKFYRAMKLIDDETCKIKYELNKDSYEHKLSGDEVMALCTKYHCLCELMGKLEELEEE